MGIARLVLQTCIIDIDIEIFRFVRVTYRVDFLYFYFYEKWAYVILVTYELLHMIDIAPNWI